MDTTPFEVRDLSHAFGSRRQRKKVLDGVSIRPCRGVVGLLGPNGAGKTTLLRVAATVLPLQQGTVTVADCDLRPHSSQGDLQAVRSACGYLPQDFPILEHYTCQEYLRYLGWLAGLPPTAADAAARAALDVVNLATEVTKKTGDLSGGMRRRLGIAQSLLTKPPVVLLDEPTTGLDPVERRRFRDLIIEIAASTTVVLSTHLLEDIARLADTVVVLSGGQVRFQGTLSELAGPSGQDPDALEDAYERLVTA